ncbi:DUF4013 domain-containing protein [Halalkalicoccus sp. NIPERK01]|uniref:DUF4013 domain-containing protein n=1 Tax=Halalkalicoccus sp. NIPERK01 TaxID=3053469 RepID=UPI00256EA714|nr:DUF4013 domain-containing protein [Halalkalicoccus sp. NIPERK01]MDL5361289.1 DUF4013 domain-containing protein [Halalkalicoccus sp. NIPERK01]
MLGDAIEYPARGEDALTTLLVGGLLPVLSAMIGFVGLVLSVVLVGIAVLPLALVPGLALFGYYVAVLRRVTAGDPDPPRFRDWRRLLVDGVRFVAVSVAYAVPLVVLAGAFLGVVAASEAAVGNAAAETVAAVAAAATALLAAGYLLVYAYLQPLALANLAREDRLGAAFDLDTLRRAGLSKAYAVAWLLAALVWVVGGALEGALWIVLVGLFVGFYADVARYYLYGRGLRRALSDGDTDAPESTEPADPFVPATESVAAPFDARTIPVIEEQDSFATRTGDRDTERGWPDWESDER